MMWNNSLLKGVWDAYMSYASWGGDRGLVVWLLLHLLVTAAQIMIIVWATGGDEKAQQIEEETWRSTYSS